MVMIGGGGSWSGEPRPATIYLYVNDVDTVYKQAVEAGAISTMEPEDQPYGDRLSGVNDRFGNVWYIATHIKDEPKRAESIS
jgi:PhnB protein